MTRRQRLRLGQDHLSATIFCALSLKITLRVTAKAGLDFAPALKRRRTFFATRLE